VNPRTTIKKLAAIKRGTRLGVGLNALALSIALSAGLPPGTAHAQQMPATQISLPAQSLHQSLLQLGQQTDIQIYYLPETVAGLNAPAVSGLLTPEQALRALFGNTGVQANWNGRTVSLSRSPSGDAAQLAPVTVVGRSPATTEGTGSYTSAVVTIGKGEQPLRDIPQAVSVITRQRMDDQGISDIRDALNSAPGVSMVANEPGGQFYSRGFFIQSYQFDGVPLERQLYARGSAFNTDTSIYDRIEIMRGPQGLFEGAGDPSGSVNLVRKRPTRERQIVLTGKAGSWDHYGAQADLAGPLNESGSVRGRLVANYGAERSFRDYLESNDRTFYGALDVDLGPATTLGLGFSRERPYGIIDWSGLPNYGDGSMPDYARSTNLSAPWNHVSKTQDTWFADLTHRFNDDWKLKVALAKVREQNDVKYLLRSGRLGPPNTFRGDAYAFDMLSRNLGGDAYLTGGTELLGRRLDVTVGANFSRQRSTDVWGWMSNVESLNASYDQRATAPELSNEEIIAANRMDDGYHSDKKGVYATARYRLADPLSIMLGGRFSWFEQTYVSDGIWGYSETTADENGKFTPFAGLIFDLDDQWSLYASYAEIFRPQSQRTVSGDFIVPVTGRNYEVGLKGELLGGRVDTSFALFRTEQKNVAFQDDGVPDDVANARCGGNCFRPSAQVRSQGFEAEVSGEAARGLQVSASYTYTQTKNLGDDVPSVGYDISSNTGVPRHMARIWANYRLPGAWHRWSMGGGIAAQSRSSNFGYYGRVQGGYTVVDARIAYQFNDRLAAALNVNNVFDKHYFESISYDHNYYGAPRSFYLTLQYRM